MTRVLSFLVAGAWLAGCSSTPSGGGPPPDATMRPVKAGTYLIGEANKRRTVGELWIDKDEVSNEKFHAFLQTEAGRSFGPPEYWNGDAPADAIRNAPVHSIPYEAAVAYATHHKKQLPTVAQWEAAARGPEGLWFPWGNSPEDGDTKAHFGFYLHDDGPAPIGHHSPAGDSWVGCRDMFGNVWEMTRDSTGDRKIIKGGSFLTHGLDDTNLGTDGTWDGTAAEGEGVGFRCVWVP